MEIAATFVMKFVNTTVKTTIIATTILIFKSGVATFIKSTKTLPAPTLLIASPIEIALPKIINNSKLNSCFIFLEFVSFVTNAIPKTPTRKVKKEVVENVLNQLLSNDNIALSQKDIANIILKKVA